MSEIDAASYNGVRTVNALDGGNACTKPVIFASFSFSFPYRRDTRQRQRGKLEPEPRVEGRNDERGGVAPSVIHPEKKNLSKPNKIDIERIKSVSWIRVSRDVY